MNAKINEIKRNEEEKNQEDLYFILVAGLPGSGKSTLAKKLASSLHFVYLERDHYKVELYDKYGFTNDIEKATLDKKAEDLFNQDIEKALKNGQSVIVDKWIKGSYESLDNVISPFHPSKIAIYLDCDYKECSRRYNERIYEPGRSMALSVIGHYPYKEGLSQIKTFSEEEMKKRAMMIDRSTFGDYRIVVNTNKNTINESFNQALAFIINVIRQ